MTHSDTMQQVAISIICYKLIKSSCKDTIPIFLNKRLFTPIPGGTPRKYFSKYCDNIRIIWWHTTEHVSHVVYSAINTAQSVVIFFCVPSRNKSLFIASDKNLDWRF